MYAQAFIKETSSSRYLVCGGLPSCETSRRSHYILVCFTTWDWCGTLFTHSWVPLPRVYCGTGFQRWEGFTPHGLRGVFLVATWQSSRELCPAQPCEIEVTVLVHTLSCELFIQSTHISFIADSRYQPSGKIHIAVFSSPPSDEACANFVWLSHLRLRWHYGFTLFLACHSFRAFIFLVSRGNFWGSIS